MKKKIVVLVIVILLLALTIQVAFADPPPDDPDNIGSCHMVASWWEPGPDPYIPDTWPGPGKAPDHANGVQDGERGMYHVHTKDMPDQVGLDGYTYGAIRMDEITETGPKAHCPPPEG